MKILVTENGVTTEEIIPEGNATKIKDIWDNIEVLDNIHIPVLNKTYPVWEITKDTIYLKDKENTLTGLVGFTKNFQYDVELIKG